MPRPERPEGALLEVRVQPRARRNEVVGRQGVALRVRVTAPPSDGRANEAVIELLARTLGVPRSSLAIVAGAASRDKRVRVSGRSLDDLRALMDGAGV